jgi:Ni/Co efflux regulator RcnB
MIAGNQRVAPEKRREKEEIRQWFRVWLETPDSFFDWLELRKASPEFVQKFGEK